MTIREQVEGLAARYLDDDGDGYGGVPFVHLWSVVALIPADAVLVTESELAAALISDFGPRMRREKAAAILSRIREAQG